jgi:type IV secretion system protein TrbG
MKTLHFALILGLLTPLKLIAAGSNIPDAYFSKQNPSLTQQERAAIAMAKKWQAASATRLKPVQGQDGSIQFLFGAQQPSVVCAVLQVCDIQLQPGEQVNSIHLGDQARWLVEPAITGQGPAEVQHLIIKPMDVGLETSLVVTTDRRTYHIRLRSHRRDFMPRVSFTYPEDAMAKWEAIKSKENRARKIKQSQTLPETNAYLGDLDFLYQITGPAAWKPLRVYNDGKKTIIQMPKTFTQKEAPVLMVVRKDGGFFAKEEATMVNYRLQKDRYIVDSVFDKAFLIAGVGSQQSRVTITKGD